MMKKHRLNEFMLASERSIIKRFKRLKGATALPTPFGDAVYVEPTREDAVLLVAHTDTVWGKKQIRLKQDGYIIRSAQKGVGIGADDRAGVAALWELRDMGHALLIVPEEESGCQGSGYIAKVYPHLIAEHRFAIQFDRRGGSELVTYSCDNEDFNKFLEGKMQGYSLTCGSFSDICELCPAGEIAGVNISIGFMHEHTASETCDVLDWERTVKKARHLLDGVCPKFEYIEEEYIFSPHSIFNDTYSQADYGFRKSDLDSGVATSLDECYEFYCPDCAEYVYMWEAECQCPSCGNESRDMYTIE